MPWGSMGSIWAEFGLDYTKFQQGVQQVTQELVTLDGKYQEAAKKMEKTVNAAMEQLGASISAASSKQQLLGSAFDGNAAKAHALEQALDELLMAGVSPTNARVQELAQELQGVRTRMEQAAQSAQQMAREVESVGQRIQSLAQEMTQVGSQISIGLTLPLSALTGFAGKASAAFETAMANVWTIADVSKSELHGFADQIEAMSTRVPQSAKQLADGLYDAISAGIREPAQAMEVVETAAKAAMAGMSDTATAVDALTTVLNSYGMAATEAGAITDVMFRTVDLGKITFGELAGNLGQVVSTAAAANVPFEQIAAAFATLTRGGVNAAEASTALNQAVLAIIDPSQEAVQYAAQLGIEFNATALQSKGLVAVLDEVERATGGNIEAITTLFPNVRSLKGVLSVTRNEMQDYNSDLEAMATASGAAERAFEKQMQTTAAQLQLFKNEVANLGRAFGAELLPMLNSAIEYTKPLMQAFTELPEGAKRATMVFATVTAAIGPLMAAVGGLVTLMSGPAGWIVAVTAVGSALYGLVSSIRDVDGQMTRMIQSAQDTISKLKDQAKEYGNNARALNDLLTKYDDLAEKAKTSETAQKELQEVVKQIGQIAPGVVTEWDSVGNAITINAGKAKEAVREMLEARRNLLEVAEARAKIEKPRLEQIVKDNESRVTAAVEKQTQAYNAMIDAQKKSAQAAELAARAAVKNADIGALRREAFDKGLISQVELDMNAILPWEIDMVWKQKVSAAEKAFGAAAESAKKTSTSFYDAKESLAEMAADAAELAAVLAKLDDGNLWAGLGVEEAKHLEKAKKEIEDIQKKYAGNAAKQLEELDKLQKAYAKLGDVGSRAVTEIGRTMDKLRAGSGGGSIPGSGKDILLDFEEIGKRIKTLPESYAKLKEAWAEIERGLISTDPRVKAAAEARAQALVGIIKDEFVRASGGIKLEPDDVGFKDAWLKGIAAASVEVKSGYKSLEKAAKEGQSELAKALEGFRHDIAMDKFVGADEQIKELERIKSSYTGTAAEKRRLDEQIYGLEKRGNLENTQATIGRYALESKSVDDLIRTQGELGKLYDELLGKGVKWEDATKAVAKALETVAKNLDAALGRQSQLDMNAIREGYDKGTTSAAGYMDYLLKVQYAHDKYSQDWLALEREKERVQSDIYRTGAELYVKQMGVFADLDGRQLFDGRKSLMSRIEEYRGLGSEADAAVGVLKTALAKLVDVERNRYDALVALDKLTASERIDMLNDWLTLVEAGSAEEERLVLELAELKREVQRTEAEGNVNSWLAVMPNTRESINEARNALGNLFRQAEASAKLIGPEYRVAAEVYAAALDRLNAHAAKVMTDEERREQEGRATRLTTLRNKYVDDPAKYLNEYKQLLIELSGEIEAAGEKWSDEWLRISSELSRVIADENLRAAQAFLDGLTPLHEMEISPLLLPIEYEARYGDLDAEKKRFEGLGDAGVAAARLIESEMGRLTSTEKTLFADAVRRGEWTTQQQIDQVDRWIKREDKGTAEHSALVTQRFELQKKLRAEDARDAIKDMKDLDTASLDQLIKWQAQVLQLRTQEPIGLIGQDARDILDDMYRQISKAIPKAQERVHTETAKSILGSLGSVDQLLDLDKARESLRKMEAEFIGYGEEGLEGLRMIRDALAEIDEAEDTRYRNAVARSEISLDQQIRDIEERMRAEEQANGKMTNLYEDLATKRYHLVRRANQETAQDTIKAYGDITSMTVEQLHDMYNELDSLYAKAALDGTEAALGADAYAGALNRVAAQIAQVTKAEVDASMARAREQYRAGDMSPEAFKRILEMRREGLAEYSGEWISLGTEIERVTEDIYRRMAEHTVQALGPLDQLTGKAREDAITLLKEELAVYSSMEQGAAAAKLLDDAIRSLTSGQDDWARKMAQVDAQLNTTFAGRVNAIYDEAAELMAKTTDPDEINKILKAAAIKSATVYAEEARQGIDAIRKMYAESPLEQVHHLGQLQGAYKNMGIAGVLAAAEIQEVIDSLNLSIEETTALLQLQVDSWQVDPLTVDLDRLDDAKAKYAGLVKDSVLIDTWFAQEAAKATEAAIKQRIGATERMSAYEVIKAEETLNAIRAIVAERVGVESEAMKAIAITSAQLALRRMELDEETERKRRALAMDRGEEMARLLDDEDKLFELSTLRKIEALRQAGWTEAQIMEWAFAQGEKVRQKQVQSEYDLRKRIGAVAVQDQLKHEQELAEASQQNANARAGAVGKMYEAVMGLAREAKLDELKGIRETMKALQLKYEAMGEGWELYVLMVKMALKQIDEEIGGKEKSWGKTIADSILRNLGAVGDAILSYQRNTEAYENPTKALVMTLADLVMKSRQFAALVDVLNPIIEELIDMFGQLIAPLVPIVDILVKILTPVIRAVAAVFAWVADIVVGIWNALAKTINFLLGWLGVNLPVIEKDWRKDYGVDGGKGGSAGTQISEITGPTRDLLIELMRPLRVLDSLPVYAASLERAIDSMREAFVAYAGGQAAANGAAAAVINNYYSINTIQIYSSGEEDFDQLMQSLNRRAELALLGSGA